jgi:hypothetical protein
MRFTPLSMRSFWGKSGSYFPKMVMKMLSA